MHPAFRVENAPRTGVHEVLSRTPLITLAWRTMQSELGRRSSEDRRRVAESSRIRHALADIAEQSYALDATKDLNASSVSTSARRLLDILHRFGVTVLASQGEPFTAEKMELWENAAQQVDPNAEEPWIAEVITPAIQWNGELLRMGRAVIAVPGNPQNEHPSSPGS